MCSSAAGVRQLCPHGPLKWTAFQRTDWAHLPCLGAKMPCQNIIIGFEHEHEISSLQGEAALLDKGHSHRSGQQATSGEGRAHRWAWYNIG